MWVVVLILFSRPAFDPRFRSAFHPRLPPKQTITNKIRVETPAGEKKRFPQWVPAVIQVSCVFYLFWQKNCSRVLYIAMPEIFRESFCNKPGSVGRPTVPDFLASQILDPDFQISCQIFYVFPCVVESSDLSTMAKPE
jgi:hypothetical protein